MRRLLAGLALALLSFSPAALHAQSAGFPLPITEPVQWRSTNSNVGTGSGGNCLNFCDSAVVSGGTRTWTGGVSTDAVVAAAFSDTTAPMATGSWRPFSTANAAADSSLWCILYITPKSGGTYTAGADTFFVTTQVSLDGVTFTTATATRLGPTSGVNIGAIMIEMTSNTNSIGMPFQVANADVGTWTGTLAGATAPTDETMFGYPFIRWIVQGDYTGQFEAKVLHW